MDQKILGSDTATRNLLLLPFAMLSSPTSHNLDAEDDQPIRSLTPI